MTDEEIMHQCEIYDNYISTLDDDPDVIEHYGTPRHSGRYPWGSGDNPFQRSRDFMANVAELKEKGIWFVCADMGGETMYDLDLTGPMGLVIGNEGEGVSRLVRKACDFTASIPMKGDIDSLNASVAAGVLAYEIVRQRLG